jgi:histidinol-phosphate aminotransferase
MAMRAKPQRGLARLKRYVPGTPIEVVQRQYGLQNVVKMASNENPWGPSPKALEAIRKALNRLNYYPDSESYDLREALANHHQLSREQVFVGNGIDGVICQICMAFLDEGCEAIVSRSSFPIYDSFIHIMRARLIKTPLKDYRLDLEAMANAITDRTRLIFVCNPNNPTGTIVTATEVDALLSRVSNDMLVVFDEAYFELVASEDFPQTLQYIHQGKKNVIILRTFSKVYGLAGVRLGYGIANPDVLALLNQVKEPFGVNLLAQAAGIAALEDTQFLRKSIEANHTSRLWLYKEFDRMGLFYLESHTNFVLLRLGPRASDVQQELLKRGVIVRPCGGYDLDDFLRVTVGTPEQNSTFMRALETVLKEFDLGSVK